MMAPGAFGLAAGLVLLLALKDKPEDAGGPFWGRLCVCGYILNHHTSSLGCNPGISVDCIHASVPQRGIWVAAMHM
jgi:hypothetical protein